MILWQMLSQYYQIIVLRDVIAKNFGRSYFQTFRQMLLPFLCEMVIPHFMADVKPNIVKILSWLMLLPRTVVDLIANIMGRCYYPSV